MSINDPYRSQALTSSDGRPDRQTYLPPPEPGSQVFATLRSTAGGSPRWLQIARDVLLSLFCLLASIAIIVTAVALYQAGDALSGITDDSPAATQPCFIPDDPTCVPSGD